MVWVFSIIFVGTRSGVGVTVREGLIDGIRLGVAVIVFRSFVYILGMAILLVEIGVAITKEVEINSVFAGAGEADRARNQL